MADGSDLSQTIHGDQAVQELQTAKPTAYVQNLSDVLHPKKPDKSTKAKKAMQSIAQAGPNHQDKVGGL
jgi:hypothetical protein